MLKQRSIESILRKQKNQTSRKLRRVSTKPYNKQHYLSGRQIYRNARFQMYMRSHWRRLTRRLLLCEFHPYLRSDFSATHHRNKVSKWTHTYPQCLRIIFFVSKRMRGPSFTLSLYYGLGMFEILCWLTFWDELGGKYKRIPCLHNQSVERRHCNFEVCPFANNERFRFCKLATIKHF